MNNTLPFEQTASQKTLIGEWDYKQLNTLDVIFGSYCVVMVLATAWAWWVNMSSLLSLGIFLAFLAANIIVSQVSVRSKRPFTIEIGRAVVGALIAPAAYLFTAPPFNLWWPGFLIMYLGGCISLGLLTGSPKHGRFLAFYYTLLFFATEATLPRPDWYTFLVTAGATAMVGLAFSEVVSMLGQTLAREREQHRQLVLEKAKSENLLQKEAEEKFRTVVETGVDGISIIAPDGTMVYTNPAYSRILGYSLEELVGQPFAALIHPDDLIEAFSKFTQLLQNPDHSTWARVRTRHKDGSWRLVEGAAKRLPDGNLVVYNRDITEQKWAEAALRRAELRFRAVFEQPLLTVRIYDPNGRLTDWNEATQHQYGLTGDQLQIYADTYNILADPEAHRLGYLPEIRRAFQGHAVSFPPLHRNLPNGGVAWVQSFLYPVKDENGVVSEVVSISQDVTAQVEAAETLKHLNEKLEKRVEERTVELEKALAESRRLAAIIEAAPDYIGIANLEGYSLYVNQAGRRMVGKPDQAYEKPWHVSTCYPSHTRPQLQEMVETALRGEVWSGELTMNRWQGQEFPIAEVTFPLRDTNGRIESLATIIRDISTQKQAETELKRAKETAEAANKAKSTFLATMSHEIRTPMNAVIGMTGLLLNTPLNPKQRDFVETIRTSGDALLTVINDILDFSKIEAGKLDLESQPFDLRQCVESALDLLANKAGEKEVELAYEMGKSVPAAIVGDVTRLRQVLVNLIGNAIKFTEQGEVVVSVNLEKRKEKGEESGKDSLLASRSSLHFSVRDTGIGIQSDKLGRLFQAFSQIDPSTTREYGGTGLGLAISKRLAELMGGQMWAESEGTGKGTTFHFTIEAETAVSPLPNRWHNRQPALAGKRLLIVDDNATNRRILNLQTQTWGMIPVEAASPGEALALLNQGEHFDLGILDVHMPEMDGVELAAALCQQHEANGHHFPLILLTSLGYETHPELEAVDCFTAFLTKPVKPSYLYDALMKALHEPECDELETAESSSLPSMPPPLPSLPPLSILLAEDVAVNQKFALLALEEIALTADVAANGLEVLEAVQRQTYDVILMDVQMPKMDGLEATRRLRTWHIPQPYIIAMTANAMQGDRELCLKAGMDDYISKPVYLEELQAALERAGKVVSKNCCYI